MRDIIRIKSVKEYNNLVGQETLHPLVSVIDFLKVNPFHFFKAQMDVYAIFLKDIKCGNITYGINDYDYEEGTLIFISPGQVYGIEGTGEKQQASGTAIIFHPNLIHGIRKESQRFTKKNLLLFPTGDFPKYFDRIFPDYFSSSRVLACSIHGAGSFEA